MLPLLLVVVLPLAWKANRAAGGLLFGSDASTAGTRRLGLNGVVAVLLASMAVIGVVGAVTLVTAVPVTGLRVAPFKNGVCVVCTPVTALANVGVTAVTTVSPGCPLTPLTTLAKVAVTPVTHVAAEAEDNSPALRLPTVSAARSVWFEADANSASRTAGRRGTIVSFRLAIRPPYESGLALNIAATVWQHRAKRVIATAHSLEFVIAVVRVQQSRSKIRWSL